MWMKMDFRFEEGVGDKMLLRLLAKRLGLEVASAEKKRAIHFGELPSLFPPREFADNSVSLHPRPVLPGASALSQALERQRWSSAAEGIRAR